MTAESSIMEIFENRHKYARRVFEKVFDWPNEYIVLTCDGDIFPAIETQFDFEQNRGEERLYCEEQEVLFFYDYKSRWSDDPVEVILDLVFLEEEIENECLKKL